MNITILKKLIPTEVVYSEYISHEDFFNRSLDDMIKSLTEISGRIPNARMTYKRYDDEYYECYVVGSRPKTEEEFQSDLNKLIDREKEEVQNRKDREEAAKLAEYETYQKLKKKYEKRSDAQTEKTNSKTSKS